VAKYAARGKGYLVVLRPLGKGLVMQQLYYPNEIRAIEDLDLGDAEVKDNELKMAIQLAEMSASEGFHPEVYRDEVQERIREQIQRKIEGEEIAMNDIEEPRAQVIDLMEALRKSLGSPKPAKNSSPAAKTAAPVAGKLPIKAKQERKAPKRAPRPVAVKAAPKSATKSRTR
jgi:DNA end-binding protein Ku